MPLRPVQLRINSEIDRRNPLLIIEAAPGSGKSYVIALRVIHGCSQGRTAMIVTSDRDLRLEYVKMTRDSKITEAILTDILGQPETFPNANLEALRRVEFRPLYGKTEIVQGKRVVLPWMEKNPWLRELYPEIADDLERSARFYDGDLTVGTPLFRTDLEQDVTLQNELIDRSELATFQGLYFKTGTLPAHFAKYIRLSALESSYVVPVITYHKFIYDTTMSVPKKHDEDTDADLSGTIYVRDEIYLDEAHEMVRIGENFTNYAFDLTRFVESFKTRKTKSTDNWYKSAVALHKAVKKLIKTSGKPDGIHLAYDEPFRKPDTPELADRKYVVHCAFEEFCARQEEIAVPTILPKDLRQTDPVEYDRQMDIRKENRDFLKSFEATGSMNSHFWSLFDVETANTLIWFAQFTRMARIVQHSEEDRIELVLSSRNPGAVFRSLTRPVRSDQTEIEQPKIIMLSGTLFRPQKEISASKTKKNFLNMMGMGDTFIKNCHTLPSGADRADPETLPKLTRIGPLLPVENIFSNDPIPYQGSFTHTQDSAIQVWANQIIDLQRASDHHRVAVLLASWADGYRIEEELKRLGIDPKNIIRSNQSNFIRATINNPEAILLTTKTNGYNIIDSNQVSLIRNFVLTRLPNGRNSERMVRRFLSWTRTLQFLGRGMRGTPSPALTVSVGDKRFTDDFFPRSWFR